MEIKEDNHGILENFVLEPYFAPGTGWHYSNSGYVLLRLIIQQVSGTEISTAYRERLWTPPALEHMFLAGEEALPEPVAHGWLDLDSDGDYDDLTARGLDAFYTGLGGGVYSNARDLAEWSQALFVEDRVVSQDTLDLMLAFHTPTPGEPLVQGYGLGVVRFAPELFNDMEVWGHSGNAPGYAAGMLYLPDYEATIVILDNTEHGEAMPTINSLLSVIEVNLDTLD
jgi:D-alanyl-D-alanine carboxypeptidase